MIVLEIVLIIAVVVIGAILAYAITPSLVRGMRRYLSTAAEHESKAVGEDPASTSNK
jgi:hypothetical protein